MPPMSMEILCQEIRDVMYFVKKGEVDKAMKILSTMLKRYGPKDNEVPQ